MVRLRTFNLLRTVATYHESKKKRKKVKYASTEKWNRKNNSPQKETVSKSELVNLINMYHQTISEYTFYFALLLLKFNFRKTTSTFQSPPEIVTGVPF